MYLFFIKPSRYFLALQWNWREFRCQIKQFHDNYSVVKNFSPELESWLREYSTEESDPETDSDRDGPPEKTIYNYNVKPRDPKFAGYWHIQNMFQFIKTGGHPPTLIGLCSILDMDLSQENVAMSIVEANGVEVLVNILEVPLPLYEILFFIKLIFSTKRWMTLNAK